MEEYRQSLDVDSALGISCLDVDGAVSAQVSAHKRVVFVAILPCSALLCELCYIVVR